MTISFTNIWKDKILDPIRSFLNTEFKSQLKVYIAEDYEANGNASIRLHGALQSTTKYGNAGFTNQYLVNINYYLLASNFNERAIEKLYRDVSRLEQLLYNKRNPNDRGETTTHNFYDGRISNIRINDKSGEEIDVDNLLTAKIDYVCKYTKVS